MLYVVEVDDGVVMVIMVGLLDYGYHDVLCSMVIIMFLCTMVTVVFS